MAGKNTRLKKMRDLVARTEAKFVTASQADGGAYGADFDGWKGVSVGSYKFVWISPCRGFVAKMDRPNMESKHGAVAEAEYYATLPAKDRVYFAVTLRAGKRMCVQPAGVPGPTWASDHTNEEKREWSAASARLKVMMGRAGYSNYDHGLKNVARYGTRYKLIDFADTNRGY